MTVSRDEGLLKIGGGGGGFFGGECRDFFGRPLSNDLTSAGACFGTNFDQPVGGFEHVEIMLDHDDAVSAIDQSLEDLQ